MTAWQTVVATMIYLYASRHFSTLVGLASPEPLANMYNTTYFRATWILTALDAGFWTAMTVRPKWLRDLASVAFSVYYMIAAERADEKVRKVRSNLTVEHLRVSWNKGNQSPYLRFLQGLVRPRFSRWPARAIRIPRPAASDYNDPVSAWLYYDGHLSDLEHHDRIILDIPGGGFVAMDPRCNDDKLFAWAAKTGLPVLSLDYKKAPEYPYPYALNECYDVYSTIINSKGRCIGLSGKEVPRVAITGDSAGGNLATGMTLMIIESGASPVGRFHGQEDLPLPDGLVLLYPGLDMNIGNWMSDEQMALIKDRRMRGTNRCIAQRKKAQYSRLVGTPRHSDDEEDSTPDITSAGQPNLEPVISREPTVTSSTDMRSPAPEYAHSAPTSWTKLQIASPSPEICRSHHDRHGSTSASHHPQPLRTRLAMSSMISYFNDRVLTPEMMRAMIILYIGPHNRPDFSQDYLLSPILAPDVLLASFPKTYFLTGERDPLVDDTVIFSGRLRRLKAAQWASQGTRLDYQDNDALSEGFNDRDVAEVVLIPGTSHGFMQFPGVYPPAWKLFDRTARWMQDIFNDAERKDRDRRRAQARDTSAGRYHLRRESSGDEDRPLEMSMSRARGQSSGHADKTGQRTDAVAAAANEGSAAQTAGKRTNTRRSRARDEEDTTLSRLQSTDDLLGRRMEGLAGGLTGTKSQVE